MKKQFDFIQIFIQAHKYPLHLNVSQFFSCKQMAVGDQRVNVMEIYFGLVKANGGFQKQAIYTLQVVGHQVQNFTLFCYHLQTKLAQIDSSRF